MASQQFELKSSVADPHFLHVQVVVIKSSIPMCANADPNVDRNCEDISY